jgi:hypothetical protein
MKKIGYHEICNDVNELMMQGALLTGLCLIHQQSFHRQSFRRQTFRRQDRFTDRSFHRHVKKNFNIVLI